MDQKNRFKFVVIAAFFVGVEVYAEDPLLGEWEAIASIPVIVHFPNRAEPPREGVLDLVHPKITGRTRQFLDLVDSVGPIPTPASLLLFNVAPAVYEAQLGVRFTFDRDGFQESENFGWEFARALKPYFSDRLWYIQPGDETEPVIGELNLLELFLRDESYDREIPFIDDRIGPHRVRTQRIHRQGIERVLGDFRLPHGNQPGSEPSDEWRWVTVDMKKTKPLSVKSGGTQQFAIFPDGVAPVVNLGLAFKGTNSLSPVIVFREEVERGVESRNGIVGAYAPTPDVPLWTADRKATGLRQVSVFGAGQIRRSLFDHLHTTYVHTWGPNGEPVDDAILADQVTEEVARRWGPRVVNVRALQASCADRFSLYGRFRRAVRSFAERILP